MADVPLLSFGDAILPETLKAQYGAVTVRPASAPRLPFRLVLPRKWKRSDAPVGRLAFESFLPLAVFLDSESVGIQVLGTIVPWEVNLLDWLEYRAFNAKMNILAAQSAITDHGQVVHAIAKGVDNTHIRVMIAGDGPQVVALMGMMPANASTETRQIVGLAAASFQFLAHSGAKTREPVLPYRDPDGLFQLMRPVSWTASPLNKLRPAKTAVDLRLVDSKETVAYLRIEADIRYARTAQQLDVIHAVTMSELRDAGVSLLNMQSVESLKDGAKQERKVGDFETPTGKGAASLLLRPVASSWLVGVLLCPKRAINPYGAMRAKRAFELVSETLADGRE